METEKILNDFLERIQSTNQLTFADLEGVIDDSGGIEAGVESYIENAKTNIFDETTKVLGWTWEELEEWYSKNWY